MCGRGAKSFSGISPCVSLSNTVPFSPFAVTAVAAVVAVFAVVSVVAAVALPVSGENPSGQRLEIAQRRDKSSSEISRDVELL